MSRLVAERADALPALAEVFREHGFEGASLATITEKTGLGKGSLYHFFPGGKAEMAAAVLAEIEAWFDENVFLALKQKGEPEQAIDQMFWAVEQYFQSGRRICLVGAFALSDTRDRFQVQINAYFSTWIEALTQTLISAGWESTSARSLAEDTVGGIQGALVLAKALEDPKVFPRIIKRLKEALRTTDFHP